MARRSTVPAALPECRGCARPIARAVWATQRGRCSACAGPAGRMARVHTMSRLAEAHDPFVRAAERRANERINRLAAKRAARESGDPLARPGTVVPLP